MMTWEELEMSAYGAFRITEQEHAAKQQQTVRKDWVAESANPAYEAWLLSQYDKRF